MTTCLEKMLLKIVFINAPFQQKKQINRPNCLEAPKPLFKVTKYPLCLFTSRHPLQLKDFFNQGLEQKRQNFWKQY